MSMKMEEPKEEEESNGHEEKESNSTNSTQEKSDEGKSEIVEEEEQGSDILEASNSSDSWQGESEGDTCGLEEEDGIEKSELWSEDDGSTSSRDDGDSDEESEGSEVLQDEEDHDTQRKAHIGYTYKAAQKEGDEKEGKGISNKEEEEDEEDGPHISRWTMETLPSKLRDPGSFSIPCEFYNLFKCHGLIDLGASVNVMPYTIYEQLDLGALKKINIRIELADSSIRTPRGLIDNIFIYVKNLIFPVDFIILDMEAHPTIPINLGRPFVATSNAIDV